MIGLVVLVKVRDGLGIMVIGLLLEQKENIILTSLRRGICTVGD